MNAQSADVVTELLADLAAAGVRLKLIDDDRIEVTAPRGALTAELRGRVAAQKPALIERLAAGRESAAELPQIVPDEERLYEPFAPTDLQQSFLIGSREGFEYYVRPHQYVEFDFDDLDPDRFVEALNRAIRRQRKNLVVAREDMLVQTVRDPADLAVTVVDLRGLAPDEAEARMLRLRASMQREEPPHDRWPWLEPQLCRYGGNRARLLYNNNNLFADAPSGTALVRDALHYYHRPDEPLPELEISFRDCALALAELEESPLGQASKAYWCERMADWPSAPDLPLVAGSEHRGRSMLSRRELLLPAELWTALKRRAEAHGLTLTNALLAAHAEVLAYWSGSRHFLLNNMISHRPLPLHPQMADVLGNFASLYPLEVDWRHDEPFGRRALRLQRQVLADMAHTYWSGAKVLQTLNQVKRTPGRAICPFAVGSAMFVGPVDRPHFSMLETPQTLLDTEFWELNDGRLWVVWDVIEAMFPEGLIEDMLAGYRMLLTRLAAGEEAWEARDFDLLPAGQRARREELNRDGAEVPTGLLHDCLPARAAQLGDKPAVATSQGELGYAELHRRAGRVAELLRRAGTGPGDLVAVVLPKGPEQVVAVSGALTAGAAYVPMDPAWPSERIAFLLSDAGIRAVLTAEALADRPDGFGGLPLVPVDGAEALGAPGPFEPAGRAPGDLAYVIYTSGSTGVPKGVMLDHRGPANTIADINRRFGIGPEDVVLGVSSLCFDLSVYDVFGTLAAGATLVMPTAAEADPAAWLELVAARRVTVWNSVPAIMQLFVEAAQSAGARFPYLRTVLLSGDWIPVTLPDAIREIAPNARVISLGGATEASIWSVFHPVVAEDRERPSIPYGRPLANQSWYVLDSTGRPAPTWVAGDLCIGGVGLALGYLGDQARTDAAFVTHPDTGERLYRTGDRGRYLPSGDLEFLGRADFQVKIQGFRVEPGEVEHVLLDHPDVAQAAVVARSSGSGKQLAAFVVGTERRPEPAGIRAFLTGRLPGYLVPSHLTVLDRLPLTANGKLDRRALEELRPEGGEGGHRPAEPTTPLQAELVAIWESVLGTAPIGVHDDFFDLGGQSFAALRVIGLVTERLGRRVPLGVMLERRTVAGLAEWLAAAEPDWSPLVRLRVRGTGEPWFLVHPAGGNVVCYRALAEGLDRDAYAFQAPGPDTGRQPLEKAEDLADLYLWALLEIQPHGPYRVGGWSSGAVLAAELARRLEALGERVERLVVVDAPAPVAPREVGEGEVLRWFLEDLDVGFDPSRLAPAAAEALAALPWDDRVARVHQLLDGHGAGLDLPAVDTALAVFRGVVRACNNYRAPRLGADITVLRAQRDEVSEFAGHPSAGAADWGWSAVTDGAVEADVLPGTHHTLLADPHTLARVADALNSR
ncbi:amino acid adenylation domain-containing protein [Kitasatospora sp. NPDC056531]|uniref:non-ribosomal peptide synthetase n=1 Tax=Kitasatospora sp. NPDC056531 TaxID=3345856 RepID=UPI0036C7F1D0